MVEKVRLVPKREKYLTWSLNPLRAVASLQLKRGKQHLAINTYLGVDVDELGNNYGFTQDQKKKKVRRHFYFVVNNILFKVVFSTISSATQYFVYLT